MEVRSSPNFLPTRALPSEIDVLTSYYPLNCRTFDYPSGEEKLIIDKYYPQYYHKCDKDGRPVYVEILGNLDMNKLFAATTPERMIKCLVYEYEKFLRERLPACEAATGKTVETSCTILDLNNVGLSNFYKVKTYVGEASTIGQNYCASHI